MSDNRAFRGVWIPAEIWESKELTLQEKVMLVEIDSLSADESRGCYKSNKAFAEFFGLSLSRVSEIIKSLEKKGFITTKYKRKGREIVERNIFIKSRFEKLEGYSENRRGVFGKPKRGIRKTEEGYSENAEESNTKESNTVRVIQKDNIGGEPKKSDHDFSSWPTKPSQEVFDEWLTMRKRKKAPVTPLVMKRIGDELTIAAKQGTLVDECLAECVVRNWTGFKAEWVNRPQFGQRQQAPINKQPETQRYTGYDSESGKQLWGDK